MADDKRAANDPLKNQEPDPRMDEFKKAPDQWKEVAKLKFGGDRTAASSLQTLIMDADASQYPALEKKLLDILANKDTTELGADFACRMLRLVGTAASVPALSKLLADEKIADSARYALQLIPGAEVDAALRAALATSKGKAKAGLIGTISARGDKESLAAIKACVSEGGDVGDAASQAVITLGGAA
jgi:hypothetical protein